MKILYYNGQPIKYLSIYENNIETIPQLDSRVCNGKYDIQLIVRSDNETYFIDIILHFSITINYNKSSHKRNTHIIFDDLCTYVFIM